MRLWNKYKTVKGAIAWRFIIIPIPAVLFFLIFLLSCSQEKGITLNRAEREYLTRKSVVVFVGEKNYPPFEFITKNGSYSGMSIELLRWIATEAGFNIEFIPMEHGDMQRLVLDGKADAVVGLFESPERRRNFILSRPYFVIPGTIFTGSERPDINSVFDLKGKTIALMVEDYSAEWLKDHSISGDFIFTADFEEAAKVVLRGKADALIGDEQAVLYFLYSSGERKSLKKIIPPLYEGQDCVAVAKSNTNLVSILNKGIDYAEKSGILKKINDKWLGIPVDAGESFYKKYGLTILIVISVITFLVIISVFWIILLRKEVRKRTEQLEIEIRKLTETENELKDAVMRYRGIYENTTDSIFWIKEENGSFIVENVNPAHKKNTGIGNDAVAGRNIEEILPHELSAPLLNNYRTCLSNGEPISYEETVTLNGSNRVFWTLLVPISDESGSYRRIVGFSRDITASKVVEMAVRHTQKLESLGVLAGGIAHDFNNLLSAIMGNIELSIYSNRNAAEGKKYLEKAILASKRAADLCSQLLAYSGKGVVEFKKVNINAMLNEMVSILNVSISKKTGLGISLADQLPVIEADPSQIRQVVMNLVINASEALGGEEGNVSLSTGCGFFSGEDLITPWVSEAVSEGDYVWINVSDTGCGMDSETLSHLFDPFFTTKFTGRGLGLSAVLGIVRGHEGVIKVSSKPGAGSDFTVLLPVKGKHGELAIQEESASAELNSGGIVMVVDDEKEVRDVASNMLELCGFRTVKSHDGADALEKLISMRDESGEVPVMILLDLTMQHMDGPETYKKIRNIFPEVRIVLMSGYSEYDISRRFAEDGIAGFLQKPFGIEELKRKISEIIK